jgi:hypothetical protein
MFRISFPNTGYINIEGLLYFLFTSGKQGGDLKTASFVLDVQLKINL